MKILIYSRAFYPSTGGIETMISILAHEFTRLGHEVKVVTQISDNNHKVFPFEIVRCPNMVTLFQLTRWCDIYFQASISLKGLWPLLFIKKTWIANHHYWYSDEEGKFRWQNWLKNYVTKYAVSICVSNATAERIPAKSIVIHNAYNKDIYYEMPEIKKEKKLVFLGRLVSDKGVDLLINSLNLLKKTKQLTPHLTIVGTGPEEKHLKHLASTSNISEQIEFIGYQSSDEVRKLLNAHKILVIPSLKGESFGIVALEGIACGCVVVSSDFGGLNEAVGNCGLTFPNGDINALTNCLADLLTNPEKISNLRKNRLKHLEEHTPERIAKEYLKVLENVLLKR